MKSLLILIVITFTSYNVFANNMSGARYSGQGNTMVASANDTFALGVNPANLVSHFDNDNSEVAINFTYLQEQADSLSGIQSVGGYFSIDNMIVGGYYNQGNAPVYLPTTQTDREFAISETYGISLAFGNSVDESDAGFLWGLGASAGTVNLWLEEDDNQQIGEAEYTFVFGGKVGYTGQINFDTWAMDTFINLAMNHQSEVLNQGSTFGDVTLIPESNSVGLMIELSILTQNNYWQIRGSIEEKQVSDERDIFNPENNYFGKDESKFGIEINISNLALRGGVSAVENTNFLSVGIGYSFEKWSIDIALAESYIDIEEQILSLSFSRRLGI